MLQQNTHLAISASLCGAPVILSPEPAAGASAKGILVEKPSQLSGALRDAKAAARAGIPVLVNLHLGKSEFRKGSISM